MGMKDYRQDGKCEEQKRLYRDETVTRCGQQRQPQQSADDLNNFVETRIH